MKPPRVTIQLEGSPADGGKLRLEEFIRQLQVITDALKESEKRLSGRERSKIQYRIVRLSQRSPATITIEPFEDVTDERKERKLEGREKRVTPREAVNTFLSDLIQIKRKKIVPDNLDYHGADKYREIGTLGARHISRIVIKNGNKKVEIDEQFRRNVDEAIGPDEAEEGSLVGRLETINIHGKNTFYIYPILGPQKVRCIFSPELKSEVKQALGERVEVEGNLMYKSWDKFPHAISVRHMETYLTDDKLPTFSDLVGVAPDATGTMTATEFIRKLRDEEW